MFFKLQELTVRRGIADKPVADPGERNFWNQRRRLQALRNRGSLPGPARGLWSWWSWWKGGSHIDRRRTPTRW